MIMLNLGESDLLMSNEENLGFPGKIEVFKRQFTIDPSQIDAESLERDLETLAKEETFDLSLARGFITSGLILSKKGDYHESDRAFKLVIRQIHPKLKTVIDKALRRESLEDPKDYLTGNQETVDREAFLKQLKV